MSKRIYGLPTPYVDSHISSQIYQNIRPLSLLSTQIKVTIREKYKV